MKSNGRSAFIQYDFSIFQFFADYFRQNNGVVFYGYGSCVHKITISHLTKMANFGINKLSADFVSLDTLTTALMTEPRNSREGGVKGRR